MTNNTARQNYLASIEQHKAAMLLWQCKLMATIATGGSKDSIDQIKHDVQMVWNHFNNLVETIDGFKSIPGDERTFIEPKTVVHHGFDKEQQ